MTADPLSILKPEPLNSRGLALQPVFGGFLGEFVLPRAMLLMLTLLLMFMMMLMTKVMMFLSLLMMMMVVVVVIATAVLRTSIRQEPTCSDVPSLEKPVAETKPL